MVAETDPLTNSNKQIRKATYVDTSRSNAFDDIRRDVFIKLSAGEVVQKEQRLGTLVMNKNEDIRGFVEIRSACGDEQRGV